MFIFGLHARYLCSLDLKAAAVGQAQRATIGYLVYNPTSCGGDSEAVSEAVFKNTLSAKGPFRNRACLQITLSSRALGLASGCMQDGPLLARDAIGLCIRHEAKRGARR